MKAYSPWAAYGLGLALPLALIVLVLGADAAEGPKTAYVGVLAVVPMLAAVFATPAITGVVAIITWMAALGFGHVASDGNVAAQRVRLIIIALSGIVAVGAAYLRVRRESKLTSALEQAAAAKQLRVLAETDQLTGLPNRRGLINRLTSTDAAALRTIAVIDCDDLKSINDNLGHQAGDEYLRAVAGRLSGNLSKNDIIARWGGDEFLVVQQLTVDRAGAALSRMHAAIHSTPISVQGSSLEGSVSVGVAEWPPEESFDQALTAADHALYEAKTRGRNQIVTASNV